MIIAELSVEGGKIMNTRTITLSSVLFALLTCVLSASSPSAGSGVGSPTAPPSSYGTRAYRNSPTTPPSRYSSRIYTNSGTSGSLTTPSSRYGDGRDYQKIPDYNYRLYTEGITNEVYGNRYYGSDVPYRSSNQINAPLGYGNLNSFLRNSSQYIHSRGYSGQFSNYYLPSRNTQTFYQNRLSGSVPSQTAVQSPRQSYYDAAYQKYYLDENNPASRGRPLQSDLVDLELQMLRESGKSDGGLDETKFNFQDQEIRKVLLEKYMDQQDKYYRQNLRSNQIETEPVQPVSRDEQNPSDDTERDLEVVSPNSPLEPGLPGLPGQRPLQTDNINPAPDTDDALSSDADGFDSLDALDPDKMLSEQDRPPQPKNSWMKNLNGRTDDPTADGSDRTDDNSYIMDLSTDHEAARSLMGLHKNYREYASAKCKSFMETGDKYLREGKFYKAADAYSLANIYSAEDPEPKLSQGIALFAAGEYLSSSQYIEMAISMSPKYAFDRINISNFLDDETLDARLVNLDKWYETSASPNFKFLAAYIYYQRGSLKNASEALQEAEDMMKNNPGVKALKKAINSAIAGSAR